MLFMCDPFFVQECRFRFIYVSTLISHIVVLLEIITGTILGYQLVDQTQTLILNEDPYRCSCKMTS
jgi:hypothetical protein